MILWTVACQAPLSVGFSRQEYWSELPPHGQAQSQKKENILYPFRKGGATIEKKKQRDFLNHMGTITSITSKTLEVLCA